MFSLCKSGSELHVHYLLLILYLMESFTLITIQECASLPLNTVSIPKTLVPGEDESLNIL